MILSFLLSFAFNSTQASACTLITTNEVRVIENGVDQTGLDFATGTFWPNRSGSYDLGERVEFFRSPTGPRAENLRFKVRGGAIFELPHAERLYYQSNPASSPVVIANRAILSPVAWHLVDGLDFEYETQRMPAIYPKYSLTMSVVTTSREMSQKLCK